MVHSYALNSTGLATVADLLKAADPENDAQIHGNGGFEALAKQGPRVDFARQNFPEMGENYEALNWFFPSRPAFKTYNKEVPTEASTVIGIVRNMEVGDKPVFDSITLWSTDDNREVLAVGTIRFGNDDLHFMIVQWLTPVHGIEILSHTTLEDIQIAYRALLEQQQIVGRIKRRRRTTAVVVATISPGTVAVPLAMMQPWLLIPGAVLAIASLTYGNLIRESRYYSSRPQRFSDWLIGSGIVGVLATFVSFLYILSVLYPHG